MRVKRGLRPAIPSGNVLLNIKKDEDLLAMNNEPTDPYFPLQWYLRNTGQNGGKIRLDLNVQAAWDQGITGKNVTTAIMDDGKLVFYVYGIQKTFIILFIIKFHISNFKLWKFGKLICYSTSCP